MGDRSISCCCCCCCGYTGAGGCGDEDVVGRGCWSINGFPGSPTAQSFSEKEKLIKIKKTSMQNFSLTVPSFLRPGKSTYFSVSG